MITHSFLFIIRILKHVGDTAEFSVSHSSLFLKRDGNGGVEYIH
jgi:hypothetical protein